MNATATFAKFATLRVFEYFDGPVLFLTVSPGGITYLALLVDRTESAEVYLYAPAGQRRIDFVATGSIDLATAFRQPEFGVLFVVEQHYDGTESVRCASPDEVDETWFPLPGTHLEGSGVPVAKKERTTISARATEIWRAVMRIRLVIEGRGRGLYPAGGLGAVLIGVQSTVEAIEEALERRARHGKLPRGWLPQALFDAAAFAESSFEIELVASHESDMHGRSIAARAAQELAGLISAGNSVDDLATRIASVQAKAAVRYRRLMNSVAQGQSSLEVAWAGPEKGSGGGAKVGARQAPEIVAILQRMGVEETDEVAFVGELRGFLSHTRSFELWDPGQQRWYRGRVHEKALPAVSSAQLGGLYRASLKAIVEREEISQKQHLKWQLVALEALPARPEGGASLS